MSAPEDLQYLKPATVIAPQDEMFSAGNAAHYFGVGASAIWAIQSALHARDALLDAPSPIRNILDMGCGCGRVARFLRAQMPQAALYVTDFRQADVAWCVKNLGCRPAAEVGAPNFYDLIWLGSVFTHLNASAARDLLERLLSYLAPNGVIVFSTQGRYPYQRLKALDLEALGEPTYVTYNLASSAIRQLLTGWETSGYGYVDYTEGAGYGVSIVQPHWYFQTVIGLADVVQLLFQERGWDDHQDIFAFMRRDLLRPRSMRFVTLGKHFAP